MSDFVIAVFPDEEKGQQAAETLSRRARADSIVVRAAALLVKEPDGTVSQRKWARHVPWKLPAAAVLGALIGFLAGPIGAVVGFVSGGFLGFTRAVSDVARAEELLREVHRQFSPGKSALVVELDEESVAAFNARVRELEGVVVAFPEIQA